MTLNNNTILDYTDDNIILDYDVEFNEIFSREDFNYTSFLKDLLKTDDLDIQEYLSQILDIENLDCNTLYNDLFLWGNTYDFEGNPKLKILKDLINKSTDSTIDLYEAFDLNDTQTITQDIIEPNNYDYSKIGIVTGISDNIVNIVGLYDVAFGEMIEILTGVESAMGMVLNIEENTVSAIIFSSDINIKPGQEVFSTSLLMSVPIGDNLLGRIVDPLGNPLDSLGKIIPSGHRFMDSIAPSIISRKSVNTPLETGLKLLIVWFLLDMVNVN